MSARRDRVTKEGLDVLSAFSWLPLAEQAYFRAICHERIRILPSGRTVTDETNTPIDVAKTERILLFLSCATNSSVSTVLSQVKWLLGNRHVKRGEV
jgi:hypothetical protein